MTSKERMILAIDREKPDRLPATIHQWQPFRLESRMGGMSVLEAFQSVGLDAQIQCFAEVYRDGRELTLAKCVSVNWKEEHEIVCDEPESRIVHHVVITPGGTLTYKTKGDTKTTWITEYPVKKDEDIYLVEKYMPVPRLDIQAVARIYDRLGDRGILRGTVWGQQPGCWQHAACLCAISDLILATFDKPGWVHELLRILVEKKLEFIASMGGAKFDLVETGGGSGSSTLISPRIHREFCLPYDKILHRALHESGFRVTYHICGGSLGIEEHIASNGADVFETLAPPSVGGNQEPWEFKKKVGNRMALIGGLDQFNVLTSGSGPEIKNKVVELFEKVGYQGGYICSPSDHFFETPVENLKFFAEAAEACRY